MCLCTGAFGCVVTAFANLYAYIIIHRHRYIHVTPTPFGRAVRIYAANERTIFQRVQAMNGRLVVLVLLRRSSPLHGRFCERLAPSQVHDSHRKMKKRIRDFLNGRIFQNYNILLDPERFILPEQSKFYFQIFEHIFIYVTFQFALSEYCARLFYTVFLSDENSCTVFVQYKKC